MVFIFKLKNPAQEFRLKYAKLNPAKSSQQMWRQDISFYVVFISQLYKLGLSLQLRCQHILQYMDIGHITCVYMHVCLHNMMPE